ADGGGMGLVVDQAHLAQVVTGFEDGQDDFAAALVGGHHAGAPRQQDEQRVGLATALDDQFASAITTLDDALGDGLGLRLGQHREQRYAPDQIEIGQHGHGSSS